MNPRLQILSAALLFSTGGAAIKLCSFSAWQVASFRSAVAGTVLFLVIREGRSFFRPRTLAVGVSYATTMLLFVSANKLTTAANTIFLQSTAPLYLLVLAPRVLGERLRRSDVLLTAVLAIGLIAFFIGSDRSFATAPDPARGNLLATLSGLSWATTILGLRWLARQPEAGSASAAVVAGNAIACVAALPFALPLPSGSALDWSILIYLGVFQIGLAYVFLTRAVERVPAFEVSLLLLIEPVLSAVWAWLLHGERPGSWSAVGCAIILVATATRAVVAARQQEVPAPQQ